MRDVYNDIRYITKFRQLVESIKKRNFTYYSSKSKWILIDGNCPFFYYWIANKANCEALKQRGYLPSDALCGVLRQSYAMYLVQRMFETNLHFRQSVVDSVNCALAPYESTLIETLPVIRAPPFRKFSNLVTVHGRFGLGLADFRDSRQFLQIGKINEFVDCLYDYRLQDHIVFVTSDFLGMKYGMKQVFKNHTFFLARKSQHTDIGLQKYKSEIKAMKSDTEGMVSLFTDIIIGSMGYRLLGTSGSSFTTLIGLLGGMNPILVSRYYSSCRNSNLYLPS